MSQSSGIIVFLYRHCRSEYRSSGYGDGQFYSAYNYIFLVTVSVLGEQQPIFLLTFCLLSQNGVTLQSYFADIRAFSVVFVMRIGITALNLSLNLPSKFLNNNIIRQCEFINGAQISNSFIVLMALSESKESLSTTQVSEIISVKSKGKLFKVSGALRDSLENRLRKFGYVEGKDIPYKKRPQTY